MRARPLNHLLPLLAILSMAGSASGQAGPVEFVVGVGPAVYDGTSAESGLGVGIRLGIEVRVSSPLTLQLDVAQHYVAAVGQVCTLGVPASCSPEDPASPIWSLRGGVALHPSTLGPLYLLGGAGLYHHVGAEDAPADAAAGLDAGLGIRISRRMSLEARVVVLRSSRSVGTLVPAALTVSF